MKKEPRDLSSCSPACMNMKDDMSPCLPVKWVLLADPPTQTLSVVGLPGEVQLCVKATFVHQ